MGTKGKTILIILCTFVIGVVLGVALSGKFRMQRTQTFTMPFMIVRFRIQRACFIPVAQAPVNKRQRQKVMLIRTADFERLIQCIDCLVPVAATLQNNERG